MVNIVTMNVFHDMKELLEWLGYRIRTMQNTT